MTECMDSRFEFPGVGDRTVVADFNGGAITSDAGLLLLGQVEERFGVLRRFAECFTDHRNPDFIEHSVRELVSQRVYALAAGYEDLVDHDDLRRDPLLASVVGKADPTGRSRRREQDRGKPLAGKSTLNRLELTPVGADASHRYKKIVASTHKIRDLLVQLFLDAHESAPNVIVLDLDATDDPTHGKQPGAFFHGYYDCSCYLPLYIFCGEHLLLGRLRPSNVDAACGALKEVIRIVAMIRHVWPNVRIILRGDSGFCRDYLMTWCEGNGVDYIFGLAKNPRLVAAIETDLGAAEVESTFHDRPARLYRELEYQTQNSWNRARRVVAKAEHLPKGPNPRFVVTSLSAEEYPTQLLYEKEYCARGDMENRIKEQQLSLFADRTSAHTMRANQRRLDFASIAYVMMHSLRRVGLAKTEMAKSQCATIRTKLLKIGALVTVTCRKIWVKMASACPYQSIFAQAYQALSRLPIFPGHGASPPPTSGRGGPLLAPA